MAKFVTIFVILVVIDILFIMSGMTAEEGFISCVLSVARGTTILKNLSDACSFLGFAGLLTFVGGFIAAGLFIVTRNDQAVSIPIIIALFGAIIPEYAAFFSKLNIGLNEMFGSSASLIVLLIIAPLIIMALIGIWDWWRSPLS